MEHSCNTEFTRRIQDGVSFCFKKTKARQEHVEQKLYRKRNDSIWARVRGGRDFKIRIFLFGGFQKAEFCHEAEKFHPCILR